MLTLVLVVVGPLTCAGLIAAGRRAAVADRARSLGPRSRWRVPARVRAPLDHRAARRRHSPGRRRKPSSTGGSRWSRSPCSPPPCHRSSRCRPCSRSWPRDRSPSSSPGPAASGAFTAELPPALEQVAAELRGGGTVAAAVDVLAAGGGAVAGDLRRVHAAHPARSAPGAGAWPAGRPTTTRPGSGRRPARSRSPPPWVGGRPTPSTGWRRRCGTGSTQWRRRARSRPRPACPRSSWGRRRSATSRSRALVDPAAVTALVDTGVGRVCLLVGLGLEALAALWIRRILRSAG